MNCKFFENFGSYQDPESWLSQSQFLLVRHAESEENKFWDTHGEGKKLTDNIRYNLLRDCHLSETGVE